MFSTNSMMMALALTVLAMTGCVPPQPEAVTPSERVVWTMQLVQEAVRNKESLFTVNQLVLMIGEPDAKVVAEDFPELLKTNRLCDHSAVDDIMERIRRGYMWSARQQSVTKYSYNPQDFLHSQLWLYGWNHPASVYVGGVVPRRVKAVHSNYFLIKDGTVIDSGGITCPSKE